MEDGFTRGYFDTNAFTDLAAIVGKPPLFTDCFPAGAVDSYLAQQ
ncbi:hypothetical protein RQM65_07140 [Pricia sp. S334]|uniref:Uncharacterized protein n=1 Tax=Pricia mediterranea TaxID=3076079 RepID=A0ABU3L5P6_9FLAO|nr:hypothetical protein [Pricia sp. S334]MDT7828432.1 hypothetical protein [Pricia sp. S334]